MLLPLRLRAAHCAALLPLTAVLMAGLPLAAKADTPGQRQEIAAAATSSPRFSIKLAAATKQSSNGAEPSSPLSL